MILLDEEQQRWYCRKDDEVYFAGSNKWQGDETPIIVQETPRCSCKRSETHIHYSSTHDFFAELGLVAFLVAEAIGAV